MRTLIVTAADPVGGEDVGGHPVTPGVQQAVHGLPVAATDLEPGADWRDAVVGEVWQEAGRAGLGVVQLHGVLVVVATVPVSSRDYDH